MVKHEDWFSLPVVAVSLLSRGISFNVLQYLAGIDWVQNLVQRPLYLEQLETVSLASMLSHQHSTLPEFLIKAAETPVLDRQGQNQVMGIGDTGLDVQHCLFRDASVPFSAFQTETGRSNNAGDPLQYFDSATHRKIRHVSILAQNGHLMSIACQLPSISGFKRSCEDSAAAWLQGTFFLTYSRRSGDFVVGRYYRAVGDFSDGNSHGTHCAGSIAGSLQAGEPLQNLWGFR